VHLTRFGSHALAGGLDLDPDLSPPDLDHPGTVAGLHILRHLDRYLDQLRLNLVMTGDREFSALSLQLGDDYQQGVMDREFRRYRFAQHAQTIRRTLRNEPGAVPLFGMSGTSCSGWSDITWEGVRLDRCLFPGRLFAFTSRKSVMRPGYVPAPRRVHLMAWQAPFPTHSLVTWDNNAELFDGPQELSDIDRRVAGYLFHTGRPLTWSPTDLRALDTWSATTSGQTLAAPEATG